MTKSVFFVSYQGFKFIKNSSRKNNKIGMVNSFDNVVIKFSVSKKDCSKIEIKNSICINVFVYEMVSFIQFMYQIKKVEDYMDLLLAENGKNSHYPYIKDFNRFMCNERKYRSRSTFADTACNALVNREYY